MMITLASMYPVETQAISSRLAPRLPIMSGRATLTIELSMTCIRAASTTANAIRYLCSAPSGGAASGSASGLSSSTSSALISPAVVMRCNNKGLASHAKLILQFLVVGDFAVRLLARSNKNYTDARGQKHSFEFREPNPPQRQREV